MAIVVPRVLMNAGAAAYTRFEAGDYWRMLRGGVLQALFSRTLTVMKYLACEIGALSVWLVLSGCSEFRLSVGQLIQNPDASE